MRLVPFGTCFLPESRHLAYIAVQSDEFAPLPVPGGINPGILEICLFYCTGIGRYGRFSTAIRHNRINSFLIWPRPGVKKKVLWFFLVRLLSYIRRQPYGQRPDGVYALSVLILPAAFIDAWKLFRFSESWADHFPIVFFLATSGEMFT